MRILYMAGFQGPDVVAQRRIIRNRALGGSRKIELISRILHKQGHDVTILSSGMPAERSGHFYSAFESTTTGISGKGVRVLYAAGLDIRFLNYVFSILSSMKLIQREYSKKPFDMLLTYNIDEFTWPVTRFYLSCIDMIPIILEYEDSIAVTGRGHNIYRRMILRWMEKWLSKRLRGVISVNSVIADRLKIKNTYTLPGIVSDEICQAVAVRKPALSGTPPYRALFCGSLVSGEGVHLIPEIAKRFKGRIRFMIAGTGPLQDTLNMAARNSEGDVDFVGYVTARELNRLLGSSDILINPHEDEPSGGILPFKLVEYLAAGGIVVTTKAGNQNDRIFDYCQITRPNAYDLTETLEYVLAHPEDMVERARCGQLWATSNYSEKIVSDELERLILEATLRR